MHPCNSQAITHQNYITIVKYLLPRIRRINVISMIFPRFLRPYAPYQVPKDVDARLDLVCESEGVDYHDDTVLDDLAMKFRLFGKCANEFGHSVPNSRLVEIDTIGESFFSLFLQVELQIWSILNQFRSKIPNNLITLSKFDKNVQISSIR